MTHLNFILRDFSLRENCLADYPSLLSQEHNNRLNIESIKSAPRILAYSNSQHKGYNFNDCIRVRKGRIYFMFTVAPENLTLNKIGYKNTWSKNRLISEQFEIEITQQQAKQMINRLTKILNKLKQKLKDLK